MKRQAKLPTLMVATSMLVFIVPAWGSAGAAWTSSTAPVSSACSPSEDATDTVDTSRPLRVVSAEPTSGLDPNQAVTHASLRVIELMYDGLVDYDAEENIVPGLAASWDISDDGLTYTFELQPDAAFSDGSPVTADDVKFSLERAAGGEALGASLELVDSVDVLSDSSVQVTLSEPSRVFINALARVGLAGILSEEAVSADADYFTLPTATSGPWVLTEWVPRSHLTLVANEHYWQGVPCIETINYTFTSDPTSAAAALESRTADMSWPMAPAEAIRLSDADVIEMHLPPAYGVLFWGMDKSQPPFDDVRVREAVAYMVPRSDRRDVCWEGTGGLSFGETILEGSWAYVDGLRKFDVPREEALEIASALLDEVGWVEGPDGIRVANGVEGVEDGTEFEVEVPFESGWLQSRCNTELLRDRLLPLGVSFQPLAYDPASFWADVADGAFTFFHGGNGWATVDDLMLQGFTTNGLSNEIVAQWSNPEVDELVAAAGRTQDLEEAKELYAQVQQIILDELPIIITGAQYSVIGVTPDLEGYYARADTSNRALITSFFPG